MSIISIADKEVLAMGVSLEACQKRMAYEQTVFGRKCILVSDATAAHVLEMSRILGVVPRPETPTE